MRRLFVLITGCLFFSTVSGQIDSSSYMLGNILYEQAKYTEAISVYERLIEQKGYSAEVNYNLGNCYYKTGDLGNSILNYERALQFDPGNDDIRYNLELANLRIRDKIGTVDELILSIWWRNILQLFTTNTWTIICMVAAWLALSGFAIYRLAKQMTWVKSGFYLFAAFFFVFILSLLITISSNNYNIHHQFAIVMEPSAILKSEPNESSTNLSLIHEGLKIQVLDQQGEWTEVKMSDGNVGWLMTASIEAI